VIDVLDSLYRLRYLFLVIRDKYTFSSITEVAPLLSENSLPSFTVLLKIFANICFINTKMEIPFLLTKTIVPSEFLVNWKFLWNVSEKIY
jgi:hypothetical protein